MPDSSGVVSEFLAGAGWNGASREPIAGDASARRYERLARGPDTAILMMSAPPAPDVVPFMHVAEYLRRLGFSPPEILAADPAAGLLLLEDLGDDIYARLVSRSPDHETEIYAAATDLLVELHRHPPPDAAATYTPRDLADLTGLVWDWYARAPEPEGLRVALSRLLEAIPDRSAVLALRDYHAENLMWLSGRSAHRRVGLLDFQDAFAGHRSYDLVSLLEDARRDVSPALREEMIKRYIRGSNVGENAFRQAFALFGAQRNLRILGVFGRLSLRDRKPEYLAFAPRVWAHLMRDLEHPALAPIADPILGSLPKPDATHLDRLRPT